MNPTRTHIASLLLPLLLAACDSDIQLPLEGEGFGGAGGGDSAEGDADGDASDADGTDSTSTVAGSGGSGGNGEGGGPILGRTPANRQELSGVGGAGGAGGGTTTGGDPDPSDVCPGESHSLVLDGTQVTLDGTTVGSTDSLDTCWSTPEADGGERIYAFDLSAPGNLHLTLTHGADLDAALVVRSVCDDAAGEYCHDVGEMGEAHSAYRTEQTLYVIVDAQGATAGDFQLIATLETNVCGDGILGGDEQCDVGLGVAGDGCVDPGEADECTSEVADAGSDLCPGEAIAVPAGASSMLASAGFSTNGFVDDYASSCEIEPGGADRVFVLTPAETGTLTVTIGTDATNTTSICADDQSDPACWDHMLHVRTTCDDMGTEVACADDFDVEELTFAVTAATPVYLFVDGYDAGTYSRGPFNLHFDLQTP